MISYLVKEVLSLKQNVFELSQLQEVLLQRFGITIDLLQLIFQFLERSLKYNSKSYTTLTMQTN